MMARPRKYQTADELEAAIDAYFVACDADKRPYTIPGLVLSLGFSDRHRA
jgi:hypothetical protein